ncbi:hypothetical protein [Streptomyces vinaceus]|uniref:hypothetical protein n=1 Tax=Streptomyces vinaceus TaxID=1960 RepID=UPI00382EBED3
MNGECIDLPHTTDLIPGHSPWNRTASTATIFTEYDCEGDNYIVMNPGKKLGLLVSVRSVIFN